ncbi:MAG TPA: KH domain-containing protein [Patescibacteria group bacterium]|nr:KH domain-containing protein [Patescibacteria group bacterium]
MEAFLTTLLKKIVAHPQSLMVTLSQDDYSFILSVHSDESDYGRIIGKKGKTINALRHLTYLWTRRNKQSSESNKKITIHLNP